MITRRLQLALSCVALALASLASPRPARACKCAPPSTSFLLPKDGAALVPTNTRVVVTADQLGLDRWIGSDPAATPDLALFTRTKNAKARPGAGARVRARVSVMLAPGSGTAFVVTPEKPLRPNTAYELVVWSKKPAERRAISSFSTGAVADLQPPAFAGLDRFTAVVAFRPATSSCDGKPPFNELTWVYGAAKDEGTAADDLLRLLYIQRKGEPRSLRLIEPAGAGKGITRSDGTLCQPVRVAMEPGDEMCAILEVVDLAGNASGAVAERCMAARRF